MQIIYKNKVEGGVSGRAGPVDPVICVGRDSRHIARECNGGVGIRRSGI